MQKIIIIEDSNLLRMKMVKVLQEYGYQQVIGFSTADLIGNTPQLFLDKVDLIITDLRLPGMSGIELTRRLNQNGKYSTIPIVFVSAYHDKKVVGEALHAGAIDYIVKPFSDEMLLERVKKVIGEPVDSEGNQEAGQIHTLKMSIVIEFERAVRGKQPVSFLKLEAAENRLQEAKNQIKKSLRKIDLIQLFEKRIFLILPLTDEKGLDIVLQKIHNQFKESDLAIGEAMRFTYAPGQSLTVHNVFEALL